MRVVRTGAVLGVALALVAGVTGAHALWGRTVPGPDVEVRTGDLAASAQWLGADTWAPPMPGATTLDRTLRVTTSGAGTTLRWSLGLTARFAAPFQSFATVQAWQGACGTGTPLGATPVGSYAPGAAVDVCARVTLAANAPSTLAGQSMSPVITVAVTQRSS